MVEIGAVRVSCGKNVFRAGLNPLIHMTIFLRKTKGWTLRTQLDEHGHLGDARTRRQHTKHAMGSGSCQGKICWGENDLYRGKSFMLKHSDEREKRSVAGMYCVICSLRGFFVLLSWQLVEVGRHVPRLGPSSGCSHR